MTKHCAKCLLLIFVSCSSFSVFTQTPVKILDNYSLVWSDEFDGRMIDTSKWDHRALGTTRGEAKVSKRNAYLDGNGNLILTITHTDSFNYVGQIATHNSFNTQYGYFECRVKVVEKNGPSVGFWLQSKTLGKTIDDPGSSGAEIDIFEYKNNDGFDKVYHTVHWNGYGEYHKRKGKIKKIKGISKGFHTFGLEWRKNKYIFYVDGKRTWCTRKGISQVPQYIILSCELVEWGGPFDLKAFPDQTIFDYVRVYKNLKKY